MAGQCLHDVIDKLVGGNAGASRVVLGKNDLASLLHLSLKHSSGRNTAHREGGQSRLHEGKPSREFQVILDDGGSGRPIASTDAGEGHIEGIALANGDGGRLCGPHR